VFHGAYWTIRRQTNSWSVKSGIGLVDSPTVNLYKL